MKPETPVRDWDSGQSAAWAVPSPSVLVKLGASTGLQTWYVLFRALHSTLDIAVSVRVNLPAVMSP